MCSHHRIQAWLASLAFVASLGVTNAATAAAATPAQWRANLDHRDPPSYVVVRSLSDSQVFLHGQIAGLSAGATYGVTLRRGTCTSRGTVLFSLPSIRIRADHHAVWTSPLTGGQAQALRAATTGAG